ncbi:GyrI-like domain-containing protein [Flavobacteriaceae bacterium]|nr:GyrI-like domain-containing protein [Flavobacteriaceae bacterium]
MQIQKIELFKVIGIKIRTTNKNGQSAKDIGSLWAKFLSENIADKIPNKIDRSILSIYTNYQGDYTQPYDTILGCKLSSLNEIPKEMIGQEFNGGEYVKYVSKGSLNKGIVYQTWDKIWKSDLNRAYTADFEVYGERAQNPENAEVDIFVAVKE